MPSIYLTVTAASSQPVNVSILARSKWIWHRRIRLSSSRGQETQQLLLQQRCWRRYHDTTVRPAENKNRGFIDLNTSQQQINRKMAAYKNICPAALHCYRKDLLTSLCNKWTPFTVQRYCNPAVSCSQSSSNIRDLEHFLPPVTCLPWTAITFWWVYMEIHIDETSHHPAGTWNPAFQHELCFLRRGIWILGWAHFEHKYPEKNCINRAALRPSLRLLSPEGIWKTTNFV
jgi:hypothetical protein